ncbi:uncharacterized protein LOC144672831 [Cetorhinus maximus]
MPAQVIAMPAQAAAIRNVDVTIQKGLQGFTADRYISFILPEETTFYFPVPSCRPVYAAAAKPRSGNLKHGLLGTGLLDGVHQHDLHTDQLKVSILPTTMLQPLGSDWVGALGQVWAHGRPCRTLGLLCPFYRPNYRPSWCLHFLADPLSGYRSEKLVVCKQKAVIQVKVSGGLKNSWQRISDLLDRCDDNLLAFFFNQFLVFRKDVQRIISSGDRDNAKTHRQNLVCLLDQAEEGDLIAFEQIISSYISIARATAAGRAENPRQIIDSLLDKLDAASLSAVLQHLLMMREHGVRISAQLNP